MNKFFRRRILPYVVCLAAASCQTVSSAPCDYLIWIPTTVETNRYLVANDRPAAVGIARNNQRFSQFTCANQ